MKIWEGWEGGNKTQREGGRVNNHINLKKTVQIVNGQNQKQPNSWNVEKGLTTIRLIRLKIEIIQLNTAC